MKKWLIEPNEINLIDDYQSITPATGFYWFDFDISEFEQCKKFLQLHSNHHFEDVHFTEISNNSGQPYFDSTEFYDLLVLSSVYQSEPSNFQHSPFIIICLKNTIITITKNEELSSLVKTLRQQKTKKAIASQENFLHFLLTTIAKGFLKLRDYLNEQLLFWRTELLNSQGMIANLADLSKLQDELGKYSLNLQQQQEILDQWQNDEENQLVDFYKLNIHYHHSQYQRLASSIQFYETKIESLLNLNYFAQSHHTNEILKVLGVISGIFLPLTFITGFFGMNLNTLPLQNTEWAANAISIVMFIVTLVLIYIFIRKKWL